MQKIPMFRDRFDCHAVDRCLGIQRAGAGLSMPVSVGGNATLVSVTCLLFLIVRRVLGVNEQYSYCHRLSEMVRIRMVVLWSWGRCSKIDRGREEGDLLRRSTESSVDRHGTIPRQRRQAAG